MARPWDTDNVPIYRTSARTGEGLPELCDGVPKDIHSHAGVSLFERQMRDEWGRFGMSVLGGALGGLGHHI